MSDPLPQKAVPPRRRRRTPLLAALVSVAVAVPLAVPLVSAQAASDRDEGTSEARRIDRVDAAISWFSCVDPTTTPAFECGTVDVPLDYDKPRGAKVQLALVRVRTATPGRKIGDLFVNPGGPGGSAVELAAAAPLFLAPDILDRFDIVGLDPRGIGNGDPVQCFRGDFDGLRSFAALGASNGLPVTGPDQTAYLAAVQPFATACSTVGRPLSASMSTAEAARDMDVVRRLLKNDKLSYLGFSYGTYLGQVYANMFPDRVRAMVVDGVLDPELWAGTPATAGTPITARIRSGEGGYRALRAFLRRCDRVGPKPTRTSTGCSFAAVGSNASKDFDTLAERLKTTPAVVDGGIFGPIEIGYGEFISTTLQSLYDQQVSTGLADFFTDIWTGSSATSSARAKAAAGRRIAAFRTKLRDARAARNPISELLAAGPRRTGVASALDGYASVQCSDSLNPQDPEAWRRAAAAADVTAPYFGAAWTWSSAWCSKYWTASDEDAYRGPFTARTANPVLVIGNTYDPATNYSGAVAASKLLPNSRLLSSASWGHTAYGTSACVTNAVGRYLVSGELPAEGTVCKSPWAPFVPVKAAAAAAARSAGAASAAGAGSPAPIVPVLPVPLLGR